MQNSNKRPRFASAMSAIEAVRLTFSAVKNRLGWRVIPLLVVLLLLATFLILGSTVPAIAPFVYTLY